MYRAVPGVRRILIMKSHSWYCLSMPVSLPRWDIELVPGGLEGIQGKVTRGLTVIFMLLGGCAVFSGLFMIYAAFCFFTLEGLEFMNVFTDGGREYGKYPIDVYGKRMLQFATIIIPYTLVQYYPLQYLLGRTESVVYIILPLIAIVFLIPCWLFWRFGVRRYKSSGS